MSKNVVIIGTLDTKGQEFLFLKNCIEQAGAKTIVVDAGIFEPFFEPDVKNVDVAQAAGRDLEALRARNDRGENVEAMMLGVAEVVKNLYAEGKLDGIISLGGTAGTTIGTYAMKALPVGVPKLQVSTVASGDTRPYVGEKDVTMMYSVVDIAGINTISKKIISNAGFAIAGMVLNELPKSTEAEKPLIAATMFGVTTPCVTTAREYMEKLGYEVLVFHCTGAGGRSMEGLIEGGFITGVLDITTTEWCDELVGGVLAAGPHRLEAAGRCGVPQVVSTGALDMVNFGPMESVPAQFRNRNLYKHNPTVSLMRTTVEENEQLGHIIAEKLNGTTGPTVLFLPLKGLSLIDSPDKPFYGPEEDAMLYSVLRDEIDGTKVELIEMDNEINDEAFAIAMAKKLHEMIEAVK